MTLFLIIAGLLLAGALLFAVPPLLGSRALRPHLVSQDAANISIYRDQLRELESDLVAGTISQEQHDAARRDIEQRLLQEVGDQARAAQAAMRTGKGVAAAVGIGVPVLAIGLYVLLGNPQGLDPAKAVNQASQEHAISEEQIAAMVDTLAAKLKEEPDNVEGWVMLARSYRVLKRYAEASGAYAQAVKQLPGDAQLLADYADALAMAQGRKLQGEPERLIAQALQADPANPKALAMAGSAAFERNDFAAAVRHWQKLLELVPEDSDIGRSVAGSIAEARSRGKLDGAKPATAAPATKVSAGTITGTVQLAPALADRVAPTDTVFVFARPAEGPRMPLATLRKQVKDLPFSFSLDDSLAMAPEAKLSGAAQVVVGARISKSGDAAAKAGDLQGLSKPVKPGASGLEIHIDSEIK